MRMHFGRGNLLNTRVDHVAVLRCWQEVGMRDSSLGEI